MLVEFQWQKLMMAHAADYMVYALKHQVFALTLLSWIGLQVQFCLVFVAVGYESMMV